MKNKNKKSGICHQTFKKNNENEDSLTGDEYPNFYLSNSANKPRFNYY